MGEEPLMILRCFVFGGMAIMLFWWLADAIWRWWCRRGNGRPD